VPRVRITPQARDKPDYGDLTVITPSSPIFPLMEAGNWAITLCKDMDPDDAIHFGFTFLSLAVAHGVVEYVKARANPRCLVQRLKIQANLRVFSTCLIDAKRIEIWPLLIDATVSLGSLENPLVWFQLRPDMVACLLAKGADPRYVPQPNHSVRSALVRTLTGVVQHYGDDPRRRSPYGSKWFAIAQLMVKQVGGLRKDDIEETTKEPPENALFTTTDVRMRDTMGFPKPGWNSGSYGSAREREIKLLENLFPVASPVKRWLGF
jgi:hypothetical protein